MEVHWTKSFSDWFLRVQCSACLLLLLTSWIYPSQFFSISPSATDLHWFWLCFYQRGIFREHDKSDKNLRCWHVCKYGFNSWLSKCPWLKFVRIAASLTFNTDEGNKVIKSNRTIALHCVTLNQYLIGHNAKTYQLGILFRIEFSAKLTFSVVWWPYFTILNWWTLVLDW